MPLHASCAALHGDGVLILGPPGAGKSDLVLRLLHRGWALVADDQVQLSTDEHDLLATPPEPLRGLLEVRGLGLVSGLPVTAPARLRLAVDLQDSPPPRLPNPATYQALGRTLPRIALHAREASAPDKVALALALAQGRHAMAAGAFAA